MLLGPNSMLFMKRMPLPPTRRSNRLTPTYKTLEQSPQNVDSERTEISVPRTELCTLGEWCEYGIVHVYGLTPQNVDSERTEEGARVERDLCVAGHVSPPSGVVTNRL